MKAWNSLIDSALIGTDKKRLETAYILPVIRDALTDDVESQRLLDAASLTHFYGKGAIQAQTAPLHIAIDIHEEQPVATAEHQALLQDILFTEYDWSAGLLARWIDGVAAKGSRVNPVQLTRLLQGIEKGKLMIGKDRVSVLGEIGKYVAQRFELLKPGVFLSDEAYFLQAPLSEIREHLYQLRKKDRNTFVNHLQQHWSSFSLKDQLGWIRLLRDLPSPEEIRFAQHLWENEFPPKEKETINYTQIRSSLAAILLSRRTDAFYRDTVEALKPYCSKQSKGFLSKLLKSGPGKTIEIPAVEDTFLNETIFHERFGLALDNKINQVAEERLKAYFLHLTTILPFQAWTELLECSSEQAFSYFKEDKSWQRMSGGQTVWELEDSFYELSGFTDDENFLLFYVATIENANYRSLLRLPLNLVENAVLSGKINMEIHTVINLFHEYEGREFSLEFAGFLLKKSWKIYQQANFYKPAGFDKLSHLIPISILPELEKYIYHTGDSPGKTQWMQDIGTSLHEYIKLKQRIEKSNL